MDQNPYFASRTKTGETSLTTNISQVIKTGIVKTEKKLVCRRIREFETYVVQKD